MNYTYDSRFWDIPVSAETRPLTAGQQQKLDRLLAFIWPEQADVKAQVIGLINETQKRLANLPLSPPRRGIAPPLSSPRKGNNAEEASAELWTEEQIVLICYGDHIKSRAPNKTPLQALGEFCRAQFQEEEFSQLTVHLLPIYESPYKDGGFDIADPFQVNPKMGTWEDVREIRQHFQVAVDFVANHLSVASDWFTRYMNDDPLFKDFFIGFDDEETVKRLEREALPKIYRPRPHNPFIPVTKPDGSTRWVYMTFSDHQADVNYHNPFVFLKMTETLLFYILQGAGMVRLDAIPYLWKEWGTSCAHHPKNHALVELTRLVVDCVNPSVKLLAESMEPLADSMRYLSDDTRTKAHLAYNFVPCGVIPHSLLNGDASVFQNNLPNFPPPRKGVNWAVVCGVTHDGSSVNPCRAPKSEQGDAVLTEEQIQAIGDYYTQHGYQELETRTALPPEHSQHVCADFFEQFEHRHNEKPRFVNDKAITDEQGNPQTVVYEAISTYASLFDQQPDKILSALSMALPLPGIPFVYLTLPFALSNDFSYYLETGNPRELNRGRVFLEDLLHNLNDPKTLTQKVFTPYKELLRLRASHPAFHPDGGIIPLASGNKAILSYFRVSVDGTQRVLVVQNVSDSEQDIEMDIDGHVSDEIVTCRDLISGEPFTCENHKLQLTLSPYALRWLE